jgi:RNA polymerase sigma factor (sigma-70 family)
VQYAYTQSRFTNAYSENVARVYAFLAYRTLSAADAEDLTQLTFERALRAWDRYDPRRAAVHTWLLAIARNALADHYRRGPASVEQPVAELKTDACEDGGLEAVLGLDPDLEAALAGIGQREREVLALRYGAELSGPEVAELLGLTLANVQQIVSRTLRRLRAELDDDKLHGQRSRPARVTAALAAT